MQETEITSNTGTLQLPLFVHRSKRVEGIKTLHPFLEFFAGSGLVAQGLKRYFRPVWANDISPKKAAVYVTNHGAEYFHPGSIADIRGKHLPAASLAWASFPCQDLSLAGLTAGIHASRSGLVWQWLRIIDEMHTRPAILVAENVVGLVSASAGAHYMTLHRALVERGYKVGAMRIDASLWTPQSRPRIFVVAVLDEMPIPSALTSSTPNWLHSDVIQKIAPSLDSWIWWKMQMPAPRSKTFSDIVEWDAPFMSAELEQKTISLISPRHLAKLNEYPLNERIALPGYKRTRFGKQVLELRFDNLSGCLRTPEGGSSREVVIIRENGKLRSRLLTVREAARLMGAPENYSIPGSYNDGYKAMGDAVAIPVAGWLAKHLLAPLVRSYEKI